MVKVPDKDVNESLDGLENEIKGTGAFDSKRESVEGGLKNKGVDPLGKLADHAKDIWNKIKVYTDEFADKYIQYPVTYEEAMKFFIDHKGDDPRFVKGAMLKFPVEEKAGKAGKIELLQVFLDKNNIPVCHADGILFGRKVLTTGLDEELLATFKDKDLVIVE